MAIAHERCDAALTLRGYIVAMRHPIAGMRVHIVTTRKRIVRLPPDIVTLRRCTRTFSS